MVTEARHYSIRVSAYARPRTKMAHLKQWYEIVVVILELRPALKQWRHENVDVSWVLQRCPHCIRQRADGVVQDQDVLVLILVKREDQIPKDRLQVGNNLGARVLFQSREGAAPGFLHAFVVVENHPKELRRSSVTSRQKQARHLLLPGWVRRIGSYARRRPFGCTS